MFRPNAVTTHYQAQIGLSVKGCAIKEFVVCGMLDKKKHVHGRNGFKISSPQVISYKKLVKFTFIYHIEKSSIVIGWFNLMPTSHQLKYQFTSLISR